MRKIMVCGDWHGSRCALDASIEDALRERCDLIFQVGDFGVTFGGGMEFPLLASEAATRSNMPIYFIDGNHEDFATIDEWVANADRDENGHIEVATNVFYVPRGSVWEWDDKVYAAMGGAASIDRDWRTEGYDYFKQELIGFSEVYELFNKNDLLDGRRIDYFFTHDCSDHTPWGFQLVPDSLSQRNRQAIDNILHIIKPRYHFHGHMHKRYEWDNNGIITTGLNFENERHSRGVLNTETGEFSFLPWHRIADPLDPKW